MVILNHEFGVKTSADTDIVDLTADVEDFISASGLKQGSVTLFVPGSTAALSTIEYESGALNDLKRAIERLAPENDTYEHNERWHDGNGYSHVRAALLGPSLHIPVVGGRMTLGTWQQIVLLDFDNRPRVRRVVLQVAGE